MSFFYNSFQISKQQASSPKTSSSPLDKRVLQPKQPKQQQQQKQQQTQNQTEKQPPAVDINSTTTTTTTTNAQSQNKTQNNNGSNKVESTTVGKYIRPKQLNQFGKKNRKFSQDPMASFF